MKSFKSLSPLKANTFRCYLISIVLQKLIVIMFFLSLAVFLIIFFAEFTPMVQIFQNKKKWHNLLLLHVTVICLLGVTGVLENKF